ncbi:glycosyltransferase family 39 protein [Rhizobium sp. NPDC090279]|uniref:glycosyltransferase family 39 protein n=1 Tax=Rhizobium sp. NPDC090279 TaxID=3364499 RepID=UPI00383B4EDE
MQQLQALQATHIRGFMRLSALAAICALVDLLLFMVLTQIGVDPMKAHVLSFISSGFLSGIYIVTRASDWIDIPTNDLSRSQQLAIFLTLRILTLGLRGGIVFATLTGFNLPVPVVGIFAACATAAMNLLGDRLFVWPVISLEKRWQLAAVGAIVYLLALRLVFLGFSDLVPEETYYWNYAQHLDIGYLDHPPMVAWLIWAGTALFGDNAFGVRVGAYLCWLLTAAFSFGLARNLFDKTTAMACVLLVSVVPFYFSTGFLMMPDAPLTAAWAATLYFLERALFGEKPSAWYGAGLSLGMGLLSKYTIVLLGPPALLLVLIDPKSRHWLGRKEPYLGAALSLLLFSPVIYWNATHEWMSFAFQGSRRVGEAFQFTLPSLIVSVVVLLTPTGLVAAAASLMANFTSVRSREAGRKALFITLSTLIPLGVFVAFSLFHENKPNWTGPLWLAILPSIAFVLVGAAGAEPFWGRRLRRAWIPTIGIAMVVYALLFHYVVLGFPGIGYIHNIRTLPVAWSEFGEAVGAVEAEVEKSSAAPVVLIGTDKYFLASEMAFYARQAQSPRSRSVGQSAVGGNSLMYDVWYPAKTLRGNTAVLVSLKRGELQQEDIAGYFLRLGDIQERVVRKNGAVVGSFYYRVGYGLGGCEGDVATCAPPSRS